MYRTRQLAAELGVTQQLLGQWFKLGAPHSRDRGGRIWVNGRDFADWVDRQVGGADVRTVSGGTAFCPRCRAAVEIQDATSTTLGEITFGDRRVPAFSRS